MNNSEYLKDVSYDERAAVELRLVKAKDHRTSPYELKGLSRDPYWFVRDYVASNPGTPVGTLVELCCDPDLRVREKAQKTLERTDVDLSDYMIPLLGQIHAAEVKRKSLEKDSLRKEVDGPSL